MINSMTAEQPAAQINGNLDKWLRCVNQKWKVWVIRERHWMISITNSKQTKKWSLTLDPAGQSDSTGFHWGRRSRCDVSHLWNLPQRHRIGPHVVYITLRIDGSASHDLQTVSVWQRAAGNGSAWCCLFFLLSVELLGLILPFYTHTLTHLSRPSFLFGCFFFVLFLYVWISPSFNDVTKTWKTRRCEEEAGEETCIFWWLFFYIDLNVYLFFEGVFVTSMTNKDSFLYSLW